jgi:signal transduction histidine kinase
MASFSQTQPAVARRESWQRWMLFWYGLFYVSLIIATGLSLTLGSLSWEESTALLGLSLLLGVWYGICITLPFSYWQQHVRLTLGYLTIGWLLWFGLVNLNPAYLFVLFGLYPQNFVLLFSPWSFIGGFILLFLSLWYQVSALGGWTEGAFFTLGTGIAGMLMALFIDALLRQSRERARLIEELEATRQELALTERQAGTLQERQRLAREIHDTFTQGFTSIVMQVEAIEVGEGAVKRTLEQMQRIARENLQEARRLLWALQPEAFEQTSLPEVLTSLAQRWSEESGISASALITGTSCPLRPEMEVTLLRAAQEALANVHKHAQASAAVLTLSYLDDVVLLDIQDDGRGFEPQNLPPSLLGQTSGGFGLKALRERVEQLGGTLTLESLSGEGTTVAVALPALSNVSLLAPDVGRERRS